MFAAGIAAAFMAIFPLEIRTLGMRETVHRLPRPCSYLWDGGSAWMRLIASPAKLPCRAPPSDLRNLRRPPAAVPPSVRQADARWARFHAPSCWGECGRAGFADRPTACRRWPCERPRAHRNKPNSRPVVRARLHTIGYTPHVPADRRDAAHPCLG